MGFSKLSLFGLWALRAATVLAVEPPAAEAAPAVPNLAVTVSTAFPEAEVFGVKLVNDHATRAILKFENNEDAPVTVNRVAGFLSTLQALPEGIPLSAGVVKNLTSTKYGVSIGAGETKQLTYTFKEDMNPQSLRLNILAMVTAKDGAVYQIQAFNDTISIVEPPTSFFDPKTLVLYLILLAGAGATLYYVYITWIETLFPQTKRGGKGGERAKRSVAGTKPAVAPKDQVSVIGADGPAVTTGSAAQKAYDENWIPQSHINRPTSARRVKSGSSKVKTKIVPQ